MFHVKFVSLLIAIEINYNDLVDYNERVLRGLINRHSLLQKIVRPFGVYEAAWTFVA